MPDHDDIQELLLRMIQLIVDHPEDVAIEAIHEDEDKTTTFRIRVNPLDVGKVIGRQAQNALSLRILVGAMGMKTRWRHCLEIEEDIRAGLPKATAH
ncbi:MAG: KH domain-containing protein [Acidobacteriaceae bacterium]|jgi:hypothetical protein